MDTVERNAIGREKRHGDVEMGPQRHQQDPANDDIQASKDLPPLKGLSFLDRFLVIWIILAMGIGIALGNTVDSIGPALQKGEFVGVSIPIGTTFLPYLPFQLSKD